jgi:MspA
MLDTTPPPAGLAMPSPPPATAKSTDGWTLALSASSETQTPAAQLNPAVPSRDFIVGGLFNGTLRAPNGAKTPTPSGLLEVGYQIQCLGGLLAALKPSSVDVPVLKDEFSGADPTATVTAFRVQVDCPGQAFIRSYAILTRTTNAADTVVAYYGANMPV